MFSRNRKTVSHLLGETQDFIGKIRCSCVTNDDLLVTFECQRCQLLRKYEELLGPKWID